LVCGGVLGSALRDDFFDRLVPEVPVGSVVFPDEDAEESFCGVGHGMVGGFCGEEKGGEFNFVGSVEGVCGEDFEEAWGELSVLEVGKKLFEIIVGNEVGDVLSGCGLSVRGHGGDFFEEGECHGRVFDVRLEDLIDFHFPSGGTGWLCGFFRRIRWGFGIFCGQCSGGGLGIDGRGTGDRCGTLRCCRGVCGLGGDGDWVFDDEVKECGDSGGEGWNDEFAGIHGLKCVDWSWGRTFRR
jgi:hypothetical protein